MYLKSIEIHGFKSFANKILFEFHDGITAIVGPNGSGKSNVADAVRWVLGEQSAKQLRGANMQDVIFSGSEARKPMGYAYVEIVFDNSDHKLAVAYDEVSVARRVYRSGESEYLINGMTCRLRDVQEMFMDTGIGKEGYSIIGQGQIDKILSTKPEDRRELFDEAAGIVKFKKRKQIAEKNLEEAKDNLARIMDIILEIEKQIGPLEKQSETAREYLRLRDILKSLEINAFLREYEKSDGAKKALEEKYSIAAADLAQAKEANADAEGEYKRLEALIEDCNTALEEGRSYRSELLLAIQKKEGEIKLFEQQLIAISQNGERIGERIAAINADIEARNSELEDFRGQKKGFAEKDKDLSKDIEAANDALNGIRTEVEELGRQIEDANAGIIRLTDNSGQVLGDIKRFETMLEQISVRKSELSSKLIANSSESAEAAQRAGELRTILDGVNLKLEDGNAKVAELEGRLSDADREVHRLIDLVEGTQQKYIGEKSRLESLRNLAERYEGYGSSIKKIMEARDRFPGICGVVADLIDVDKKYETAVEVALGASVQHIITEDEATAKSVIDFLKKNKFGRATFLPITSVGHRKNDVPAEVMKEKGVISDAASLVKADKKYAGIVDHLLKAFIVTDTVDNALALAKKYDYSLRIVTLEGEQLAPGGSIAGGAFKNSGNLLGRKREIAQLEKELAKLEDELAAAKEAQSAASETKRSVRIEIEKQRSVLSELLVEQNSARLNLEKEEQNISRIKDKAAAYESESIELERKSAEIKASVEGQNRRLSDNEDAKQAYTKSIDDFNGRLVTLRFGEGEALERLNRLRVEQANVAQAGSFADENIDRILQEIAKLKSELTRISESGNASAKEAEKITADIESHRTAIDTENAKIKELDTRIAELVEKKESITGEHKSFFDSWAELGRKVTELEKEVMRLENQREKLADQLDAQISYIWEEYELTVTTAEDFRDPNFRSSTSRKDIADTRSSIKALGDVNVNAIEDYKEISERYKLFSSQRDDLISSQESIQGIIDELDSEMRKRFEEQFEYIKKEFNSVFRELFGGGKGELELVEDEDMLEAGIRIIAQPPGKKLQNMMQLSGGEKALTAIALLFAIQNLKPSPFCLLDEIEAALDDSNVKRFSSYLHKLTKNSQFIVITHRRGTMSAADILYGITMQEKGVSTLVSVSLIEGDLDK